ncbi:helix-turn-helix domain-containing protein [Psychrobacter phenylpyruvicus]|uniref:Transposase and inactivated derivatives n=1 Tax=Psychrobacter phenylpyruvicus TaxID=29432 RepID=A0A379LKN7_9GAMM|nr:helix-turn-helix domain-containing protein [Psychrobacter phenylpyruvicus]SUD91118.1 Transposase and inactivated derivatives [Psychrobacter phenylpyruvicus]
MRYNLDFKMKVIAYYEQGHTKNATAETFNVNRNFVLKWVEQYQSGGIDAIKPRTTKAKYSSEFKLKVLTTMLEQGLSQSEVALKFNISSPALISHWHKVYREHGLSGLISKPKGRATMSKPFITDKPDDEKTPAELRRELEYLRAENAYLKKLDALLREKEKKQASRKQGSSKG